MQIITPGRKNLANMSRYTPRHIASWHFRRLLKACYWNLCVLLVWFAEEAIRSFPSAEEGVMFVIGDGGHKDKRGKKHPAAQKGKQSTHTAYFFGIKFVLLIVSWGAYRIPVDFELVLPKHHPDDQTTLLSVSADLDSLARACPSTQDLLGYLPNAPNCDTSETSRSARNGRTMRPNEPGYS